MQVFVTLCTTLGSLRVIDIFMLGGHISSIFWFIFDSHSNT